MKNWSTDTKRLEKNENIFTKWKLEQMINFGLDDEKLPEKQVRKHFNKLNIDPLKKIFLKHLLWPTQS